MDPQLLQLLKDAAIVIQALLDERQQMMGQQYQPEPKQPPQQQQQQSEKVAGESSARHSFCQAVGNDFYTKTAFSDEEDGTEKMMAAEAEILEIFYK